MAFVAEYISKEDLKKYNVIDTVNKIRTKFRKPLLSDQDIRWLNWVVDKQKQTYLIFIGSPQLPDPRDGYTGEDIWLLHYKGKNIELDIRRIYDKTTSKMLVDNPFFIKYKLESINSSTYGISLDELYKVLGEALIEYGESGIHGRKFLPKEHEVVTFLHD
ncbi:hypothetical protein [uncultured Campylobacter sp.]|uniref:hypothetical protein n=1 Tax=uncultured Campylobacter sp. TaxID=218934 RepID=UPI002603BF58|nr:hypothetical protein [uncultured Campylobacter sp.]